VTVSFITVEDQNRVSKEPRRRALTKCSWLLTRVEGKRVVRAPDSVVKLGQQMEDVLVGLPRDKRVCAQVSAGHAWLREAAVHRSATHKGELIPLMLGDGPRRLVDRAGEEAQDSADEE
jgi:hypothetical protein